MRHFPAFFDLQGRICLVVGTGAQADAKAALLAQAGADVIPQPADGAPVIPDGCTLAIIAGVDRPDAWLAALRGARVPVNVADRPDLCDFVLPAIIDRDPVTIAVGTGGLSPVLARLLRGRIERAVPPAFGALARFAGAWRDRVRDALPAAARRRFWETVLDGPIADRVLAGADADSAMAAALDRAALPATGQAGIVHLVGVGSDDPDLLTIKAMRLLGAADVVVHDGNVGRAILDLARRDAERVVVSGGQAGRHLVRLALQGRRVVRLCAGNPPEDEATGVAAAGIAVDALPDVVVPPQGMPQRVAAARV